MPDSITNQLLQAVANSHGLYYRLILLVGPSGSGKTHTFQALAELFQQSVCNVNLEISGKLLEFPVKQRPLKISGLVSDLIGSGDSPAILDNLEILFDVDLKQDPLKLLMGNARNRVVAASWNGVYSDGKLIYEESKHPEYRCYDVQETSNIVIVSTEQNEKTVSV